MRTISIDTKTAQHLRTWKERQKQYLQTLEAPQRPETPVCCSEVGGFLDVKNLGAWWHRWREEAGFPDLKFHELRHTQATQLLAAGMDVKTVQARLGHASASLTLNQYAHAVPEKDRECAEMIEQLFSEDERSALPENKFTVLKTA